MAPTEKQVLGVAGGILLALAALWKWRKRPRVFISFDYDNDEDLRTLLVGQAKNARTPFDFVDWSLKHATPNWKAEAVAAIRRSEAVLVICGAHTDTARGVTEEIRIARQEQRRYFLLRGRRDIPCTRPVGVARGDVMHDWKWDTLAELLKG